MDDHQTALLIAENMKYGLILVQLMAISWGIGSLTTAVKEIVVELKKGNSK